MMIYSYVMNKWIFSILFMLFTAIFLISMFFFFNGSLEMYPTDEQKDKIKIVSSLIGGICLIVDVILIRLKTTRG